MLRREAVYSVNTLAPSFREFSSRMICPANLGQNSAAIHFG